MEVRGGGGVPVGSQPRGGSLPVEGGVPGTPGGTSTVRRAGRRERWYGTGRRHSARRPAGGWWARRLSKRHNWFQKEIGLAGPPIHALLDTRALGNVWEWGIPNRIAGRRLGHEPDSSKRPALSSSPIPVLGGSFDMKCQNSELVAFPPLELARNGYYSIGFRCALAQAPIPSDMLEAVLKFAEHYSVEMSDDAEEFATGDRLGSAT